ncbi:MAG TPA: hypothetical protein VGL93_25460 [Streptosporangiaceae bacterium]|jgi:hypothetical protein
MRLLSADSPVRLPWTTLRLAGRYILPLATWFAVGQALHWLIIWFGVTIGHGGMHQLRVVAVLALLVVLAMVTVTVPILMLHSMRHGVSATQDKTEVDGLATVISRSMLPFVIIYFAWGMIRDDASAFSRRDIEQNWTQFYTSLHPEAGMIFFGLGFGVSLAIAIGCYYIRAACEMLANRRDNRVFPMVAAFFETGFNVFGLFSIVQVVTSGKNWFTERHVWSAITQFVTSLGDAIPGWDAFWGMVADAWPNFTDAVMLPLLWLTLASVVYGRELFDERETARGTRLERLYAKYDSLSSFQRWMLDHVLTSFRERWAPITGAVRLAMRAGGPAVGVFCLCYVAIDVLTALGARGVVELIGYQRDIAVWGPIMVPITFVRDMLRTVLQTGLLAAMFDLAVRHEKRRLAAAAEVSAGTPEPGPSPLASGYPTGSPAPASAAPPHALG